MDIPITISFKGNSAELDRDLFGLGEKVIDPEILKFLKDSKDLRYVNEKTTIIDGVSLSHKPGQLAKATESLEPSFVDLHYIISLANSTLGLSMNSYAIADWFLNKIQKHDCKISIDNKEVKTKEEFQSTLDEFIQKN